MTSYETEFDHFMLGFATAWAETDPSENSFRVPAGYPVEDMVPEDAAYFSGIMFAEALVCDQG